MGCCRVRRRTTWCVPAWRCTGSRPIHRRGSGARPVLRPALSVVAEPVRHRGRAGGHHGGLRRHVGRGPAVTHRDPAHRLRGQLGPRGRSADTGAAPWTARAGRGPDLVGLDDRGHHRRPGRPAPAGSCCWGRTATTPSLPMTSPRRGARSPGRCCRASPIGCHAGTCSMARSWPSVARTASAWTPCRTWTSASARTGPGSRPMA